MIGMNLWIILNNYLMFEKLTVVPVQVKISSMYFRSESRGGKTAPHWPAAKKRGEVITRFLNSLT